MASYLASRQAPAKNQTQPVLAQAKPAITTGAVGLCEKFETALKFSPPANVAFSQEQDSLARFNNNYNQKIRHIEDDCVIQKQNASNQMRQAAVMAAVASQQKVRLSATERLAMTAKRPTTNQQIQQLTTTKHEPVSGNKNNSGNISAHNSSPVVAASNTKMGPLPTLETLLAVQRQLQQHTKQHLNPVSSQASLGKQNESSIAAERSKALPLPQKSLQQQQATSCVTQPPPPPTPPPPTTTTTTSFDTYDKDLPPLPASLSPSTTTDDSQMNSLDSHQSSPETSLVSLPPPPPPISSYLEQYDEVNSSCHQSIKSTSSSPCTLSTISDISSVRHFPALQVKPNNLTSAPPTTTTNPPVYQASANHHLNLPSSYASPAENVTNGVTTKAPPPKPAPKPPTLPKSQYINLYAPPLPPPSQTAAQSYNDDNVKHQHSPPPQPRITQASHVTATQPLPLQPTPPAALSRQQPAPYQQPISSLASGQHPPPPPRPSPAQINYQRHMFDQVQQQTQQQMPSLTFMPQPPPPLSMAASGGFDEPDSGSFRFPTPPPPDLLLDSSEDEYDVGKEEVVGDEDDEDVDDDDFQCKIPTPPPHQHIGGSNKSMSVASFQASDLLCGGVQKQHLQHHYNNNSQHSSSPIFSSSTFSVDAVQTTKDNQLQPAQPLFRHQAPNPTPPPPPPPPAPPGQHPPNQLTVNINNETTGLLSTANLRQDRHHHHHHHHHHFAISNNGSNNHGNSNGHHIMLAMTASSSSPSSTSSSDNDGHSSNSSSSTSGIHSSIDSPSSSNDFNYGVAKTKTKLDLKNTANNNHLEAHLLRKNNSGSDLSSCGLRSGNNQRPPITTTVTTTARRPALKQKKTVSFSDKVELVACADEQHDGHLPNPLLARVLAGKMQ